MDVREYIQRQFSAVLRFSDAVTGDLTEEQLNWAPPGTANSIGLTLLHCLNSEDRRIQSDLRGMPRLFESGGWSERLRVAPPGQGKGWEEARGTSFSLTALLGYQEAVRAATHAYLATVTPEELERPVPFRGEEQPLGQVLAHFLAHTAHHLGEIAALKGVHGAKGLPF